MKKLFINSFGLIFLLLLFACDSSQTPDLPLKMRTLAFGTWVDITVYDLPPEHADAVGEQLDDALQQMHNDWHAWHPGELNSINNQLKLGKTVTLDDQMLQLIELAIAMEKSSNGLFNPAIGDLLKLWGFQRDDPFNVEEIPKQQQIDNYLASSPSTTQLRLKNNLLSTVNTQVQLDFGGFGKGFGVQLLLQQLHHQGLKNVLINAGGDLMLSGKASSHPWNIAIENPFKGSALATLSLEGEHAVFTSGNYERGYSVNGIKYHHIINPLTGYPATGVASVTVIGKDGAWSDAAATTLLLAGVDSAFELAPRMGVLHLLLITDDGQYHMDEGMLRHIKFFEPKPSKIITHVLTQQP